MNFRIIACAVALSCAYVAAYAQGAAQPDLAKARDVVNRVCSACHGLDGNSTIPVNPRLAGQQEDYLLKELRNFKAQDGKPPARQNPIMNGIVTGLSQQDMVSLAAYFARQKPKPAAAHDPDLVKIGQQIYRGGIMSKEVPACASCHSPDGAGVPAEFPRLAGQHRAYTVSQLKNFRTGARANDPNAMMRTIASRLSDKEIAAVAEYMVGLH